MSLFRHLLLFSLVHDPYSPLYKTHICCFNLLVIFAIFNVPRLQQFHTTVAVTQVQHECIRHRLKVQTVYSSANNWLKERTMPLRRWPKKRLLWQLNILLPYSFPSWATRFVFTS